MRSTQAITATLKPLYEELTPASAMRLLVEACATGGEIWSFDRAAAHDVSPTEACARAVHLLVDLEAATVIVENQLAGQEVDASLVADASQLFAGLVYLGHAALQTHAATHRYDPSRRVTSMHVHAAMQLERVVGVLDLGAGRRILAPCIGPIRDSIAIAIVEAKPDELDFAEAATVWAGASLGLYAIAAAASS